MKKAFLFCMISLLALSAQAQSNHYWNVNFNAEASLLSGAVVGGGAGITSIYYNPALLTEVEDVSSSLPTSNASISINANLFTLDVYQLQNVFGSGEDFNDSYLGVQPRFFSFLLRPDKKQRVSMEFAYFTRSENFLEMAAGNHDKMDYYPNFAGQEIFSSILDVQKDYKDKWYGLGVGYEILPGFSLGASFFASFKSEVARLRVSNKIFSENDSVIINGVPISSPISSVEYYERVKWYNTQALVKLGARYAGKRVSVGLVFTTPAFSVNNSADVTREFHRINLWDFDEERFLPDIAVADFQEKLPARFKTPYSVAVGFNYSHPQDLWMISTAVEYFQGIDPYKSIEGGINPNITSNEVFEMLPQKDWLTRVAGAREIWNAGIGIRKRVSPKFILLAGFRTDFNTQKKLDYKDLEVYPPSQDVKMNIFHIVGGGRFNIAGHNIIFGLQYSGGREDNIPTLGNWDSFLPYVGGDLPYPFPKNQEGMNARLHSVGMFFGLTLNLRKKAESESK